jgi:hypothetical protein
MKDRIGEAWGSAALWMLVGIMSRACGNYIWEQEHLKLRVEFGEAMAFGVLFVTELVIACVMTAYTARKEGE